MKKYVFLILIAILTGQSVYSQITEYIDLTTKGVLIKELIMIIIP